MTMLKDEIDEYTVTGTTIDNVWVYKNFTLLERCAKDEMRQHGYVPALDIEPKIVVSYNDKGHFEYTMTLYGVYKGLFAKDYEGYISEWNVYI